MSVRRSGRPKRTNRYRCLPHLRIGCPWRNPDGSCKTFRCSRCKRTLPWCQGSSDDYPGRCDRCANRAHRKGKAKS